MSNLVVLDGTQYDMPPHEVDRNALEYLMVTLDVEPSCVYCVYQCDGGWQVSAETAYQEWRTVGRVEALQDAQKVILTDHHKEWGQASQDRGEAGLLE